MNTEKLASQVVSGSKMIRQPAGSGEGYWVGAPGCFLDRRDGLWCLAYRVRRPRGVMPDRGAELHIARSADGVRFEDIRTLLKHSFATTSIERCMPWRGTDGQWRLFMSYVDPADGRWCVSALKAPSIHTLDARSVQRVVSAAQLHLQGVKDPWIMAHDGLFHMFLSVAIATPNTGAQSHSTHDIYNTGQCISATGLATSHDLNHWKWEGVIFQPDKPGWDGYCRRINSVVPCAGKFLAFYDGSASHLENYEEKTGLAVSEDLKTWRSITPDAPALTSPDTSKSLRYIDAVPMDRHVRLYYESARNDGSHDLRTAHVEAKLLEEIVQAG